MPVSVVKRQDKVHAAAVRWEQLACWLEDACLEGDVEKILEAKRSELAARITYEAALNVLDRARAVVNAKQRRKRSRRSLETRERINVRKRAVKASQRTGS